MAKEGTLSLADLRKLTDEAGKLQQKHSKAQKEYYAKRKELVKAIETLYGENVPAFVPGRKYQADYRFDKHDKMDVIEFLEKVDDEPTLRAVLRVAMEQAREMIDEDLQEGLIEKGVQDDKCTLHIESLK